MKNTFKSIDYASNPPIAVFTLAKYPFFSPSASAPIPCYQIIWLCRGTINYKPDMQHGAIQSGQILCVRNGQFFSFENEGNACGYCIMIANGYFEGVEYLALSANPAGIPIRPEDIEELQDVVRKMATETSTVRATRHDILRHYVDIFLIYVRRSIEQLFKVTTKNRNIELTEDFMSLVERNYKEKKLVSNYARLLAVTPNHLNEIVKKVTGQSAGYHIRQRVVLEAKRHAMYSNFCMKEVASLLGFADLAHFSRFFKNATGRNFTDFKRDRLTFSVPGILSNETRVTI